MKLYEVLGVSGTNGAMHGTMLLYMAMLCEDQTLQCDELGLVRMCCVSGLG